MTSIIPSWLDEMEKHFEVLWDYKISLILKEKFYRNVIRSILLCDTKYRIINRHYTQKMSA